MGVVDVNSMNLDELKRLKQILNTCDDKVARVGSIVIYDNQIGEDLCIITETEKMKYGIMSAPLDTALGKELYLTKVGDKIKPFSWPTKNSKIVKVDNILRMEDIIDIMMIPDENKRNNIVTTSDIVLGLSEEEIALYKVRGNVIADVTGLAYGESGFSHQKIGDIVALESGKVKILNAITERQFKNRIMNYK